EAVRRCRNCGYDFSLAEPIDGAASGGDAVWIGGQPADPELAIRPPASTPHPLDDLALLDAAIARRPVRPFSDAGPDLDRVFGDDAAPVLTAPNELPLSGSALDRGTGTPGLIDRGIGAPGLINDDQPLITRPSPPRAPLAVRRSTPEVPRLRAEAPRLATLDLESEPPPPAPATMQSSAYVRAAANASGIEWGSGEDAEIGARVLAAAIDLSILAAIDIVVLYFTLQICGVSMSELNVLPKIPLFGFLVAQNIGYLVAFTAGGQTLGKMAAGIRIVPAD